MIISEHMNNHYHHHINPTFHIPPWNIPEDQMVDMPYTYLYRHNADIDSDSDSDNEYSDYLLDVYSSDQFRMYEFKVRRCTRERSHDWTDCPYAHPGEKARRRDPRKYFYSGAPCPDYRKGNCKKGDVCEHGHGVFECWLHPTRYRTQVCKDGLNCTRRVCFFAHTVEQLRVGSALSPRKSVETYDGPPLGKVVSSPVSDLVSTLCQLQLSKVNSLPSSWVGSPVYGSPRGSILRPGSLSLPNTPTRIEPRQGFGYLGNGEIDEPIMERVESGRDLRAKMFEKLRNENNLDRVDPVLFADSGPDVGWVSDLVM